MSTKTHKQTTKFEMDKINKDYHEDNDVSGTVDRTRMSWILNLILNKKTQREIVKDIADGILDFKEIEEMFPWNYVQKLRKHTPKNVQNYLNRFKNMTDERMKGLLSLMLSRKSHGEMLKLITDHTLDLDDIQKSYLLSHVRKEENESNTTSNANLNLPMSSEILSSKSPNNIDVKNSKEPKDVDAKKRSTTKKGEKETDTKKRGLYVEKAAKKVRVVKLKNEKCVGDDIGGNKVVDGIKDISPSEENGFLRVDSEKASSDLEESFMRSRYEGFEESSLKSQGDRVTYKSPARYDTKKTANLKSLASSDVKLAGAKKASNEVGKYVKLGIKNKGKREVKNFALSSRSDDYTEEKEKSKSDESDVENENAGTSFVMRNDYLPEIRHSEGFHDSSQANEIVNFASSTVREQDTRGNKYGGSSSFQGYNFNKLNYETKMIRIKEEPKSECSFNKFDYPIDQKKLLLTCEYCRNRKDFQSKLLTKSDKTMPNEKVTQVKTIVTKSKKVTAPSNIAKPKKHCSNAKKENTKRKTKVTGDKKSVKYIKSVQLRRIDRQERRKKERIMRHEKKIQQIMAQFSDQVVTLVKDMGYLQEDAESSSSHSFNEESSYSSSSDSCSFSCNCCDSSSCSDCGSSCSYTDTDTDTYSDTYSDSESDTDSNSNSNSDSDSDSNSDSDSDSDSGSDSHSYTDSDDNNEE